MNYLLLFYSRLDNKYMYRLFTELESAFKFREKILKSGITQTCYCYKLYGRKSKIL